MKLFAPLLLTLLIMCSQSYGQQAKGGSGGSGGPKGFNAYLAFGNNFSFPGSVRIGWGEWELGQISMGMFGVVKRNYFSPIFYTEFGPIVAGVAGKIGFGFVAGIGFDYKIWLGLSSRGEILGTVKHNGHLESRGNLGLAFSF